MIVESRLKSGMPYNQSVRSIRCQTQEDGTPDKRFKENKKTTPAATGPVKKDGTPDKRYKVNKKQ